VRKFVWVCPEKGRLEIFRLNRIAANLAAAGLNTCQQGAGVPDWTAASLAAE